MFTHTILRIDASARKNGSISRDLADQVIARLAPQTTLTRDLTKALPQIDEAWIGANFTPAEARTEDQQAALALFDSLVAELQAADTVGISTPIYNFGMPCALKAWIDLAASAGLAPAAACRLVLREPPGLGRRAPDGHQRLADGVGCGAGWRPSTSICSVLGLRRGSPHVPRRRNNDRKCFAYAFEEWAT